jgi:hypothetical protein
MNDLSIRRFPSGVTVTQVGIGAGFVADIEGMPSELRGRVIMTCSHCTCFDGMTPAFGRYIHGKFLVADCPSGFWDATSAYVSATPWFERGQFPLIDSLRAHMDALHKVIRVYTPSQELFPDVAILILDNSIPGTTGERVFANLWVPPADAPLLVDGRTFIVGYGLIGHRPKQNYAAFGTFADAVKYGAVEERGKLSEALGRNTKKVIDISGDASFGDDNDINVRHRSKDRKRLPNSGSGKQRRTCDLEER